jgi:hypothetical protein
MSDKPTTVREPSVRERIAAIHAQQLSGDTSPIQAAQWQATLGALIGNVLAEIREAEGDYHVVYARLLDSEGKANRATIRAQMTPEWKRWREAKDTLKLVESMATGLRALTFAHRTEERLTR